MRPWFALLLLALAQPAAASIDVSWDACSPIVADRLLPPGATESHLFFSVTGLSGNVSAFQFNFHYGASFSPECGAGSPPDSWRFDNAGCMGPSFIEYIVNSTHRDCPQLLPANAISILNTSFNPLDEKITTTIARSVGGAGVAANSSTRYLLVEMVFSHLFTVAGPGSPGETCGGFEKPICFTFQGSFDAHGNCAPGGGGSYVDGNGNEHPFGTFPPVIATFRSVESSVACNGATPATPTTWGAIRAQYR